MTPKRLSNKRNKSKSKSTDIVRAEIFFSGRVQRTGFRAKAQDEAISLGLNGQVENLDDGRVRAICEGPEPKIKEFIKIMKNGDGLARVEGVDTSYSTAKRSFKGFKVKCGDLASEMWQGFGTAERILTSMDKELKVVGNKVDSMHGDVNERFDSLDGKYHIIGESLVETNKNLEKMNANNAMTNENIKNLTEAMMKIIDDYISEKKKQQGNGKSQT